MRPAVFLDRDGTLIEHVHYLSDPNDVLLPGAARAVRDLRRGGFVCVVVTNQSAVGRGLLSRERLGEIHAEMERQLAAEGAALDAVLYSPAVPRDSDRKVVEDPYRKPGPGMLWEAAIEHCIDLARSWMVGDMISDILAGRNASCGGCILVRSGKPGEADETDAAVDHVAEDLFEASRLILEHVGRRSRNLARLRMGKPGEGGDR